MATTNVRQLDDNVVRRLEHRASENNRFLDGEVRHVLENVVENDLSGKRTSFLTLSTRLHRTTKGRAHTPAEVLIREDRDHGHRES